MNILHSPVAGLNTVGPPVQLMFNMADHFLGKILYDIIRWSFIRQRKQARRENEWKTMEIISWQ